MPPPNNPLAYTELETSEIPIKAQLRKTIYNKPAINGLLPVMNQSRTLMNTPSPVMNQPRTLLNGPTPLMMYGRLTTPVNGQSPTSSVGAPVTPSPT